MTTTHQTAPTKAFWIICIIALLWNLMGLAQFFMMFFMTPEAMSNLSEAERALYEDIPAWVNTFFALAVIAGTLGSVLLLMKKALAKIVFIVSLVAVVIQMSHWLFLSDVISVLGAGSVVMPLLVFTFAAFLVWYVNYVKEKGWIS